MIILNHTEETKLTTDQMYWDQTNKYFFSEKPFTLTSPSSTIKGVGFESQEDLTKHVSKNITGTILTKDDDL